MDRTELMALHAAARARREAAPLGSDAFREAAEEIARIEIEIAAGEEPSPDERVGSAGESGAAHSVAIDRGAARGP